MMAIPPEMNSKGLVLSLKKRKELWSAVHFPYKKWDMSSRSRATTAMDKKSVMHVKIKLLFCQFKPFVVHSLLSTLYLLIKFPTVWRLSNHLCFKSCPTLRNFSLTERRSILFSGIYLSGRKSPIGPVAGHAKNPILPFGLGLNFLLFFRQRFLK